MDTTTTAPLFTLGIALLVVASFAPLLWSAMRDRITAMHLNREMNAETIQAREDAREAWEVETTEWAARQAADDEQAAWEAEAAEWMQELRRRDAAEAKALKAVRRLRTWQPVRTHRVGVAAPPPPQVDLASVEPVTFA